MNGTAVAISYGAVTIINAIAIGRGAAIGVDLWTKAQVQITNDPGIIESTILSDPAETSVLIERTVKRVFKHFNLEKLGAKVKTWSNIPIARGLKSSSAAGNAITLATIAALKKELDEVMVVKLGVSGAIDAKVTVTGAFDDACASFFGGVIFTDNLRKKIVKRSEITEDILVLFHVPAKKAYTVRSDVDKMKMVAPLVSIAYDTAFEGDYWTALTLNGLIYSSVLGYTPSIAIDALEAGAFAAGLSGTGPAVSAIVPHEKTDAIKEAWQSYEGDILEARINHETAKVLE